MNSYKRLVAGGEAPTAATWGAANRSALVRVPMYTPSKASSRADRGAQPRLGVQPVPDVRGAARRRACAASRRATCCRPQAEDDVWSLTDTERRAMGYEELPGCLGDALTAMESSELVAEALGEHVFDFFLRNKREEFDSYRQNVTPFELRRYLPGL